MNNFTHYQLKKDFCRRKYFFIDPQPPYLPNGQKIRWSKREESCLPMLPKCYRNFKEHWPMGFLENKNIFQTLKQIFFHIIFNMLKVTDSKLNLQNFPYLLFILLLSFYQRHDKHSHHFLKMTMLQTTLDSQFYRVAPSQLSLTSLLFGWFVFIYISF